MSAAEVSIRPKGRITRAYSPEERSQAVAAYNETGNLEKVSKALGIPLSTLSTWTSNPNYNSSQNRTNLADKFEFAANLFTDLAIKKSKKANFSHLVTAAGISVDKMQLLRGQPTAITEDIQRTELTIVLASALGSALDVPVIDVEAEKQ